jgi:hypothetical protein
MHATRHVQGTQLAGADVVERDFVAGLSKLEDTDAPRGDDREFLAGIAFAEEIGPRVKVDDAGLREKGPLELCRSFAEKRNLAENFALRGAGSASARDGARHVGSLRNRRPVVAPEGDPAPRVG